MEEKLLEQISQDLKIGLNQVTNTMELLEQGSTVPFIARYRKERTHGLDEEQIRLIQEQYAYQENLEKRKEEVLHRIETLGHLTEDLKLQIMHCTKLVEVEEIYRPYKQKKKTCASIAKEKGLEPWLTRLPLVRDILMPKRFKNISMTKLKRLMKLCKVLKIFWLNASVKMKKCAIKSLIRC